MLKNSGTSKGWQSGSPITGKTVLITGASSGIGLEFARLFARDGFNLVLVARNQASLEHLAIELAAAHPIQVTVIVQDLTDPASPEVILEQLSSKSISIDVLVNNAGTQVYGEFIKANLEQQLAMI